VGLFIKLKFQCGAAGPPFSVSAVSVWASQLHLSFSVGTWPRTGAQWTVSTCTEWAVGCGAPRRHSERSCGAHGLIRHLPLHTRPRADPTRCLKCPACNISSVFHLHASMAEPIGSTSPHTVKVGASVESRAATAMEAVPMIVEHGPVPSWLRKRARSSAFLAWWWLVGSAPDCGATCRLATPRSHALV
jgi:hypothetical protein